MDRDRLRAYWRATVVVVALAAVLVLDRLLGHVVVEWSRLTLLAAFLLVAVVATVRHRPRPWATPWAAPARERARVAAVTNGEALAPAAREVALDRARRGLWLPIQQLTVWAVQAVLWSGFDWAPGWVALLSLGVVGVEVYALRYLRRRIARVDAYDDTVPAATPAGPDGGSSQADRR